MGPMRAVNLILNPRFADNANTWSPASYQATGDPNLSVRATNLAIARTSDAGQQWALTRFATKPGKEYVVSVVSVSFEGEFLNGRSVAVTDKQNASVIGSLGGVAHGMNSFRFTASEDEANLRLYASSGAETIWKEPMVVASDEWEWLQSGNIDYFDYSLMPDPRGGGVFLLAFLLMLSAALSGGWRHEDSESASRRRMPAEGGRVGSGLRGDCGAGRGRLVDVPVPGPVQEFRAVRLAGRRDDGPRRVLLLSTHRTLVGVFLFGEHYLGCRRAGLVRRDHEARREQERLHARGFERQAVGERDLFAAGLGEGQGHVRCRRPADAMVLGRHDAAAAELDAHGLGVVA